MSTQYFEEYQKQLNDWQQQFVDWQKQFVDVWTKNIPDGKLEPDLQKTFESNLNLQKELVQQYLENQEKATKMMLDTQKQFWDNYFETMEKVKTPVAA
jgi:hypothetical protein